MIGGINLTSGSWRVALPNGLSGCHEVLAEDDRVIGMAHEYHDAVLMASSKDMFDALVDVHGILMDVEDSEVKESIEARLSIAFEKIVAEADV